MDNSTTSTQNQNTTSNAPAVQPKQGRIKTGWSLFKESWKLLRSDKTIFRFIIVSGFFSLILLAIYTSVLIIGHHSFLRSTTSTTYSTNYSTGANSYVTKKQYTLSPLGLIPTVIYYILAFFIVNIYSAGIVANLISRFKGTKQSYGDSMKVAWSKAGKLFSYSVIEATVGLILRAIAERSRLLGRIAVALVGVAWSIARLFAVPIIVEDNEGPFQSVKDSSKLLISTWGENIVGRASMGGALFLVALLIILPVGIVLFILGGLLGGVGIAIAAALFFLMILAYIIVGNAANSVLNVALYYYARYKQVPPDYNPELLKSVFRYKKQKGTTLS